MILFSTLYAQIYTSLYIVGLPYEGFPFLSCQIFNTLTTKTIHFYSSNFVRAYFISNFDKNGFCVKAYMSNEWSGSEAIISFEYREDSLHHLITMLLW